jgi:hypothetical protein
MVSRSTSTPDAIILSPLQGGTRILPVPEVKTPGLVLLSLRDKSDQADGRNVEYTDAFNTDNDDIHFHSRCPVSNGRPR